MTERVSVTKTTESHLYLAERGRLDADSANVKGAQFKVIPAWAGRESFA
jgi:hypothetical protein